MNRTKTDSLPESVFLLVTCPPSTKQGSEAETLAPLDMQALRSQCYPKRQTRVTRWERQVPWQIEDKQDCQGSPRSFLCGEDGRGLAEIAFSSERVKIKPMEDPHVEYLREFESACDQLPEESDWEESFELKDTAQDLLIAGCVEWNQGNVLLREITDGLDYEGWLCHLVFYDANERDFHGYGKGVCVADSVLAALVQIEVELMLSKV